MTCSVGQAGELLVRAPGLFARIPESEAGGDRLAVPWAAAGVSATGAV